MRRLFAKGIEYWFLVLKQPRLSVVSNKLTIDEKRELSTGSAVSGMGMKPASYHALAANLALVPVSQTSLPVRWIGIFWSRCPPAPL